jgi:hypothetical protein
MANPAITVMQLELALNNMQNTMVKEDGTLALDETFLKMFDDLMLKLQESRRVAESLRKKS